MKKSTSPTLRGPKRDSLGRIAGTLDRVLEAVLISIFVALVIVVVLQVASRYLANNPTTWTEEVARFLFIWLGLVGSAYASGGMRHLSIDILPLALSGVVKRVLLVALEFLVISFSGSVLIYGGYSLAARTLANGQMTPTLNLPMGWIYMAVPAAGVFIIFYAIIHIVRLVQNRDPAYDRLKLTDEDFSVASPCEDPIR